MCIFAEIDDKNRVKRQVSTYTIEIGVWIAPDFYR